MSHVTRRRFLQTTFAAGTAIASSSIVARAADEKPEPGKGTIAVEAPKDKPKRPGPSAEALRVAVIGVGGRGSSHIGDLLSDSEHVQIVALCDADKAHTGNNAKRIAEATGDAPREYQDIRRLLEDRDIDAVTIATPNHWHTLAAIWAIQAGKDVYVEKPCSHNVSEGRRIVEYARKYSKIVQHGTQSRSSPALRSAIKEMQNGLIGKITLARAMCYKKRDSIGKVDGPQTPPPSVDYDLWLGPAPQKPVMRKQFHYDWHWFWDYGNGDIGNQGVHQMDIAYWGIGKQELPKRVQSIGGRFGYIDDGETPNTQIGLMHYDDVDVIFEVRGLKTPPLSGTGVGNIFYGTDGTLVVDGTKPQFYDKAGKKIDVKLDADGGNHFVNWTKACRTRKLDDLNAEIEIGHHPAAMCHLVNNSFQLGSPQPFLAKQEAFDDDKTAYATLARMEEHLADNGLKLEETQYWVGPSLDFDPKTERFTNNKEANKLLTREYRAPFVVPEKVV